MVIISLVRRDYKPRKSAAFLLAMARGNRISHISTMMTCWSLGLSIAMRNFPSLWILLATATDLTHPQIVWCFKIHVCWLFCPKRFFTSIKNGFVQKSAIPQSYKFQSYRIHWWGAQFVWCHMAATSDAKAYRLKQRGRRKWPEWCAARGCSWQSYLWRCIQLINCLRKTNLNSTR